MQFNAIKDQESWARRISHYNHDFYHTWDFHSLSKSNGEGDPVLFYLEQDGETIAFPLLERSIIGTEYKDLTSVYGYPGPLFSTVDTVLQNTLLNSLLTKISELGYISIFSRLHPIINGDTLASSLNIGDVVYFDLTQSIETIYASMRKVHRRDVRKLKQSDLVLKKHNRITALEISEFKHIYDTTMNQLQARDYYYFNKEYYKNLVNSDQYSVSLYTVYSNNKAISSAMMVRTGVFGQYHLSGTLPDFYKENSTKLILATTMEDMHQAGLKYFVLGGGVGAERDSLFDFKYGFGRNTAPFNVMKQVLNQSTYNELVTNHFEELGINCQDEIQFFPLYRYSK